MENNLRKYCFDGSRKFNIKRFDTSDTGAFESREQAVDEFVENLRRINKEQQKLYAERKEGVIFLFQAMDAAGKDGTIRTVFSTLSPHGVKEYCFKVPSSVELSHDFIWRFWSALPARGNISIFNRSYYEDVLVGKVHKLYENQILPERIDKDEIINNRYDYINDFEKYLYNTGTRVVKIFLDVSKDEQARRFISRIDTSEKNWKISPNDIKERAYWDEYMDAFESMVNKTSKKDSPWYVVPSDHKWYARLIVSRIVLNTLREMHPRFPEAEDNEGIAALRQNLVDSLSDKESLMPNKSMGKFANPTEVTVEMIADEENRKVEQKKEEIVNSGFREIRKLLATDYILKSRKDIVDTISQAMSETNNIENNNEQKEITENGNSQ